MTDDIMEPNQTAGARRTRFAGAVRHDLNALLERARLFVASLTPAERAEMRLRQRVSWAKGNSTVDCSVGERPGAPTIDELTAARIDALKAQIAAAARSSPNDLRALGWVVAVHNDYRLDGVDHTFWLLTKNGRAVKGEGKSDAEALDEIRSFLGLPRTQL